MIKTLLVGLGQIGMGYDLGHASEQIVLTHAKALTLHPEFNLVCAVDPDAVHRRIFADAYHKPAYETVEQALAAHPVIELVVVATPTDLHAGIINQLLSKISPKAILCEKPLSYSIEEAEALVRRCRSEDVSLFVNYIRRSDPGVVCIKELIANGELIQPIKGVAWYSKGFMHNGSHFFNLLEFWLGNFQRAKIINEGRVLGDDDCEPDVHVIFERGEVVFLAAWEEHYSHYSIELLSPSGRLIYGRGGEEIFWQKIRPDPVVPGYTQLNPEAAVIDNDMNRYQWNVLEQVVAALSGQKNSLCTGVEGLRTISAMKDILSLIKAN